MLMIPVRKNRKVRKVIGMAIYTLCNMVEHCFIKVKNTRHYDHLSAGPTDRAGYSDGVAHPSVRLSAGLPA